MIARPVRSHRLQCGMVLITSLLLLVVVTLLAVSMFRSFGIDEKIAGNIRDKQRATAAAESAVVFAIVGYHVDCRGAAAAELARNQARWPCPTSSAPPP